MSHRIVFYGKPECHLCELAHQMLLGLSAEYNITIEEIDITRDPDLFKKYWDKIPVLMIDGRKTLAEPICIADVRDALEGKSQDTPM